MRIALEAMGGDHGPRPAVEGAVLAAERYNIEVALVGRRRHLERLLTALKVDDPRISIVDAPDVIGMNESPRKTLAKRQSSLAVATDLVKRGEADALVSAGNTGAVLAHTLLSWRTLPHIKKPAIATYLPTAHKDVIVIDAGANVDCKPHQLVHFAIMGSVYAQYVLKREAPRVGLLSNGEEETKGNEVVIETNQLLRQTDLNFLGNVEGNDVFSGDVDVVACDGFTGNVLLKAAEGIASLMFKMMKKEVSRSILAMIGAAAILPAARRIKKRCDYDEYGGAPLLGVNGVAIIAHGRSNKKAFMNALRVAADCYNLNLVRHLHEELIRIGKQIGETADTGAKE
ncbi:MAG: phosphate acyltransferase [Candidatus Sumerlaeota bacterium]|nr:phosphate acyltransferase [Candidatus Sumerlaeota bacterium]